VRRLIVVEAPTAAPGWERTSLAGGRLHSEERPVLARLASSTGRTLQELQDGRGVNVPVSSEPASWGCVEVCGSEHDQSNAVRGDELIAAGFVEGTLDAAVDSADGQTIRLVEVSDGVVVLESPQPTVGGGHDRLLEHRP